MPWVRGKKYSFWEAFFGVSGIRLPPTLSKKKDVAEDPSPKEATTDTTAAAPAAVTVSQEEIVAAVIAALEAKGIIPTPKPAPEAPPPPEASPTAPASVTNDPSRPWTSADDKLLIKLKEEENKPWKYIIEKLERNKSDIRRRHKELIDARVARLEERAKRRAKRKEGIDMEATKEDKKGTGKEKEKEPEPESNKETEAATNGRRKSASASWAQEVGARQTYTAPKPWSLEDCFVGTGTYIAPNAPQNLAMPTAAATPVAPVTPITPVAPVAPNPLYWQAPQYQYYNPGFVYPYVVPCSAPTSHAAQGQASPSGTLNTGQVTVLNEAEGKHDEAKWDYLGSRLYDVAGLRKQNENVKGKATSQPSGSTGGRSRKGTKAGKASKASKASKAEDNAWDRPSNSGNGGNGQNNQDYGDTWAQYTTESPEANANEASNDTDNQANDTSGDSWDQPSKTGDNIPDATAGW